MTQAELLRYITKAHSPVATIAVSSGKGGVGKTAMAVAISNFLAEAGHRVCLIDGDLGLANVDIMLGLSSKLNLYHLAKGEATLDDVLVKVKDNFYVLPGGSGIRELMNMDRSMRERLVLELIKLDGKVDYIIADTAAGISDEVLLFCVSCQDVLVVVTPEPTSVTDAYALLKILYKDYSKKEVKVLLNRVEGSEDTAVLSHLELVAGKFLGGMRLIKVGEIPKSDVFPRLLREQSLVALEGVKNAFMPLVEKLVDPKVFRKDERGLSRLAIGFLRFRGVSAGLG